MDEGQALARRSFGLRCTSWPDAALSHPASVEWWSSPVEGYRRSGVFFPERRFPGTARVLRCGSLAAGVCAGVVEARCEYVGAFFEEALGRMAENGVVWCTLVTQGVIQV